MGGEQDGQDGEGRTARLSDFSVLSRVWASAQGKEEEASAYPQVTVKGDGGKRGAGVKGTFSLSFW